MHAVCVYLQMDPLLRDNSDPDSDVLIIHQHSDNKFVNLEIIPRLSDKGLESLKSSQLKCVSKCNATLLIVSDDFMNIPFLTLETILAFEKLQNLRENSVWALISKAMKDSHHDLVEIPFLKKAIKIILDENCIEKQLNMLTKQINGKFCNDITVQLPFH